MKSTITWTPIKERPLTTEEKAICGEYISMVYDCPLPYDGQEVLVSGRLGVDQTTYYGDEYGYFEGYEVGEVDAWSPMPRPYHPENERSDTLWIVRDLQLETSEIIQN